jgi:hypothetical protein
VSPSRTHALYEVVLHTGRTHQIRVHFSESGVQREQRTRRRQCTPGMADSSAALADVGRGFR